MSKSKEQIVVKDADDAELQAVQKICQWFYDHPNAEWIRYKNSNQFEECASGKDKLSDLAFPIRAKYPDFRGLICRSKMPNLYNNKPGIWVPISGCDGCTIVDGNFEYNLTVGKKYEMLELSTMVSLRVKDGGMLCMLWFLEP